MPGLFNPLESDLEYIWSVGIRHVISLTETPVAVETYAELRFYHFPIDDMGVPTLRKAAVICDLVLSLVKRQEPVLVHCKAGLGRTGTLLGCCLISMGSTSDLVLARLRSLCSYYVQNQIQEYFLGHYAEFIQLRGTSSVEPPKGPAHDQHQILLDPTLDALIPALDEVSNGITLATGGGGGTPLVYVNKAFERITGYIADEVLGRNCRLLQGPETDPRAIERLRSAISEGQSCHLCLHNYRKDGTVFLNELKILPVGGEPGCPAYFIGIQNDVTALLLARAYQRQPPSQVTDLLSVEHLGSSFDVRLPTLEITSKPTA